MKRLLYCLFAIFWAVACTPQRDEALPTLVNVNQVATDNAPTASPTRRGINLPATFTPTPQPPTETPTITPVPPTATPLFAPSGTIYYVYNNDSIIALSADGLNNTLVMTFGVGKPIKDLSASWDEQYLTFVAPGNGTAQEVYIMNRDGSYLQQISCLGYGDVRSPIFDPQTRTITWFAAPEVDKPGNIYSATIAGSNQCPSGNAQAILVRLETTLFEGMTWNRAGTRLFFSKGAELLVFDPVSQATEVGATQLTSLPNALPQQNRQTDELVFVSGQLATNGAVEATATILNDSTDSGKRNTMRTLFPPTITGVAWSADNRFLLGTTTTALYVRDNQTGGVTPILDNLTNPIGLISPDSLYVAYTRPDRNNVAQWFLYNIGADKGEALTQNTEGTITEAIWLSGGLTP